ncbi:MAG: T9SS sorting signal type C domain-containing protein, partial [Oligoflexus sp.]|nr:T9SS sorting signal type C domain-containing protein [Pseudopedobacter sp.]
VTITASANNLYNATASINGVSASISNYSPTMATATVIKAIIPATAVSGTLITTNNLGCQASNVFTVLDNIATSCQGGSTASELFISEFTDSNSGALSYIEIYNGTGVSKNLSTYSLKTANNGGAYSFTLPLNNFNLASGSTYVVAVGNDNSCSAVPGGNGFYAAQSSLVGSVNFTTNGHDHIGLFNGATLIDSWGVFGSNNWAPAFIGIDGATFRRKNTATLPSTTYSNSDWNIVDYLGTGVGYCANNDYSDIGIYNFRAGIPPTVSPLTYTPTCKATTLTVTGTEGFVGGNPLVYSWYAVQNGSNTWNLIVDGGVYSGATTNALTISDIATLLNYQFYCQVRENTATCYIASNAVKITSSISTTWQTGNTWSNLTPTLNTAVFINNDYDTANLFSPSFDACSLTINSAKTVTIRATNYVNIQNDLTVTGNLNIENNGSLVMIDDSGVVANTGITQVKRTAAGIRGYDYVYWSSPVTGQFVDTMYASPAPGPIYKWNPLAPNINPLSSGTWQPATGAMTAGTGYIVRGSSTYSMAASSIPSIFTGAVNSGIVPSTINRGSYTGANYAGANTVTVTKFDDNWNLIGNPYPSSIKALDFLTFNTNIQGFVYLWTHGTAPVSTTNSFYNSFAYNYTTNDYIAYNGTGTTSGPLGFNGYIASGQGFLVSMNDGPGSPDPTATQNVNFKNSMRNKNYANSQFYRTSQVTDEKHRIWLDVLDASNQSVRTLVGYVPEATLGLDRLYDAYKNTANGLNIYSLAQNETLTIQGRPLPFDSDDQVPIGVRIMQNGEYKIAIAAVDGLFSQVTQNIYLEDKLLGVIYDLRQNPYIFNATAGIINDRFVLRYNRSTLKNPDIGTVDNSVILIANHGQIIIKSYGESIENVTVFDILGRQLFEAKSIGSKDFKADNISESQQALIVKIKLENGIIVTRKVIL